MNLSKLTADLPQNSQVKEHLYGRWREVLEKTKRIWSWDTSSELAFLCEYATQCDTILELGTYVGKSAACMLLANPELRMVCIDLWDDEGTFEEAQFNLRHFEGRVEFVRSDTHSALRSMASEIIPRDPFCGVFVDAGHLLTDVKGDIELATPLIKPGALWLGHDYRRDLPEDGVTKAVRELITDYENPVDSIWSGYRQ
jgi:predicted O-methyltransferase YrrM